MIIVVGVEVGVSVGARVGVWEGVGVGVSLGVKVGTPIVGVTPIGVAEGCVVKVGEGVHVHVGRGVGVRVAVGNAVRAAGRRGTNSRWPTNMRSMLRQLASMICCTLVPVAAAIDPSVSPARTV